MAEPLQQRPLVRYDWSQISFSNWANPNATILQNYNPGRQQYALTGQPTEQYADYDDEEYEEYDDEYDDDNECTHLD